MIGGDNGVYVNTSGGNANTWSYLGGWAFSISAGSDGSGHDQVFAIGGDHYLYVHDAYSDPSWARWVQVDSSTAFAQLSAGQHNQVFALDSNGALHDDWYFSYPFGGGGSWANQTISPSVAGDRYVALSADSQDGTHDEVYVIDTNKTAYLRQSGGWKANPVDYSVIELAGADGGWFYDTNPGSTWQWNGSSWQWLSGTIV
jgi:hypothetical protein